MLSTQMSKFAALGALGVCGGIIVTYVALAWLSLPTAVGGAPGATGGIDTITRNVLWLAALVPVALFLWSHLSFARQLQRGPTSLNS